MHLKKAVVILSVLTLLVWASAELFRYGLADVYASVGRKSLAAGDLKGAEIHLARSIHQVGSNAAYYYAYAEALHALARKARSRDRALQLLERAERAYKQATELNPREGNPWVGLGQTCWWLAKFKGHEKERERVESCFLKALATDPNNGKFLYALINYYLFSGMEARGEKYVKRLAMVYPGAYRSLKTNPHWSRSLQACFEEGLEAAAADSLVGGPALRLLASIAAERKQWARAAAWMETLLNRPGSRASSSLLLNLGYYCLESRNRARAKEALVEGMELSRRRQRDLQNLLWLCRRTSALDLYVELCQKTAGFDPAVRANLPLLLGRAYFYQNDLQAAASQFQRSLQAKETAEAHYYLGQVAVRNMNWDRAELESQRATVLEPQRSEYHYLFARTLQAQKKYPAALEAMSRAIEYAKQPRDYYYNAEALLHWRLKDYHSAIQAWESARRLAPENAYYPRQIARAYGMLKDFANAERYYRTAVELRPGDPRLRQELASIRKQNQEEGHRPPRIIDSNLSGG